MSQSDAWTTSEAGGVALRHPAEWPLAATDEHTLLTVRSPSQSPEGFFANVNAVQREATTADAAELLDQQVAELSQLEEVEILSQGIGQLGTRTATHLVCAIHARELELTLEQWMVPLGETAITISVTAASSNYDDESDTLTAIAKSLELR